MSLRKIAGLLIAGGLSIALIGGGVGAAFTAGGTAAQDLKVGSFGCAITSDHGTVVDNTVTYGTIADPLPIMSSAAGSYPFTFTVTSTGTIPVKVQVTETTSPIAPFASLLALPVPDVTLAAGASHPYAAGLQWPELGMSDLNKAPSVTYTVNCIETGSPTVTLYSTNRGVYGGQDSVRFAGSGSGFTPGATITSLVYTWAAGSWDLHDWFGAIGLSDPVADASGNFTYWFADNCHNGHQYTTDQAVTVVATDGTHTATGTGILACSLMLP